MPKKEEYIGKRALQDKPSKDKTDNQVKSRWENISNQEQSPPKKLQESETPKVKQKIEFKPLQNSVEKQISQPVESVDKTYDHTPKIKSETAQNSNKWVKRTNITSINTENNYSNKTKSGIEPVQKSTTSRVKRTVKTVKKVEPKYNNTSDIKQKIDNDNRVKQTSLNIEDNYDNTPKSWSEPAQESAGKRIKQSVDSINNEKNTTVENQVQNHSNSQLEHSSGGKRLKKDSSDVSQDSSNVSDTVKNQLKTENQNDIGSETSELGSITESLENSKDISNNHRVTNTEGKTNKKSDKKSHQSNENTGRNKLRLVLIIICCAILCGCVAYLIHYMIQSNHQINGDADIISQYTILNRNDESDELIDKTDIEIEENDLTFNCPIDFESLWSVNPDVVAWIEIPSLDDVSYPLVYKEGDNDYYLRRNWNGESRTAGSIFIDGNCSGDLTDPYTIIYGHNMNNGSMFGQLKKYRDESFYQDNGGQIIIYTPTECRTYEMFAIQIVDAADPDIYSIGYYYGNAFMGYIQNIQNNTMYPMPLTEHQVNDTVIVGDTLSQLENVITLSTCTTPNTRRLVLSARLIEQVEWSTNEK